MGGWEQKEESEEPIVMVARGGEVVLVLVVWRGGGGGESGGGGGGDEDDTVSFLFAALRARESEGNNIPGMQNNYSSDEGCPGSYGWEPGFC